MFEKLKALFRPAIRPIVKPSEQKAEEPDILDEIEALFDKMKDSDLSMSNIVEHNELVCSNLLLAYYLAKLERRLGNGS